jgi:ubiquinol-cytochrome c reductase iron-sulfur subunit
MSTGGVDTGRRRFLTAATCVVGGVGTAATLVPFLASFKPSARAQAAGAPVEIDISKVEPGQQLTVEWRGKPVWIVRRTEQMLSTLDELVDQLRDPQSVKDQQPEYARNSARSIRPEYLVVVGICTHLGCSPKFRPDIGAADLGADWKGGFFCPCHGSKFDLAGRVYQGVPAPLNLEIPPYQYLTDNRLLIGVDQGAA